MTRIRRGYVDTASGQIHYRSAGSRTDTPLVMLHQTASSSQMYEAAMAHLAEEHWIIALDTPGFGHSGALPERPTIAGYARALKEAVDALGVAVCRLVGHHTGASIAVQIAHDDPALVKELVLSGPPLLTESQRIELRELIPRFAVRDDGAHLTAMWNRLRNKDPEAPMALRHREFMLSLAAGDQYRLAYIAVAEHQFATQLAAITCPVLVFAGDRDSLHDSLAPSMQLLRNGVQRVIPDGTTYVWDRQPDAAVALLRDFFSA